MLKQAIIATLNKANPKPRPWTYFKLKIQF